jgi:hypothetical protein
MKSRRAGVNPAAFRSGGDRRCQGGDHGSNVKVAAAGASLDVPLGHKDVPWSFPHFDTITVSRCPTRLGPMKSLSRDRHRGWRSPA